MDLIELRYALRRNWAIGVIVALLIAVGGALAVGPGEARYSARTTVLATPRVERLASGSTAVLRVLLPNVHAFSTSDRIVADAARILKESPDDVGVSGSFEEGTGILTLVASSADGERAIAWSRAIGNALVEEYEQDPYLTIEVLDPAESAALPGKLEQNVDLVAIGLLALIAGLLVVFVAQRLREAGDVVAHLRHRGITVVGELPVSGRGTRDERTGSDDARRIALSLSNASGVSGDTRFVVVGESNSPTVAVVDAVRSGLAAVGKTGHRVSLGPPLGDRVAVQNAVNGRGVCVAVLDRRQGIGAFIDEVHALDRSETSVAGVIVLRRG